LLPKYQDGVLVNIIFFLLNKLLFHYLNEGDACHEQLGNKYIHSKTLWTVELKPYGLPSFSQRVDDWKKKSFRQRCFYCR
jgi:hypothetical protein